VSGAPYPPNGTAFTEFLAALNGGSSDGVTLTGCFAGHCDWRIPTVVELQTILSMPYECDVSPCIDAVFGPTVATYYRTSTTYVDGPSFAWGVDFGDGFVDASLKSGGDFVRAVRGGS
jgi:hypothetical protein